MENITVLFVETTDVQYGLLDTLANKFTLDLFK